jgi:hypothetical protein
MTNLKTSILVNRQVPEFVREEYPLFIEFLEAYYEFLEDAQGNQLNDLTTQAKNLRDISDVDISIDKFESQFFDTFASLFPRDAQVNKEFLIKNVLPLYLAKGSVSSFKFLFRLLFDDEVNITYPKTNILKASDGKWVVDNVLKIETDVRSVYTGDGTTRMFYLTGCRCPIRNVSLPISGNLFVNGVLQTSGYTIFQESKKLIFNTAPANNAKIEFYYNNIDITILENRKITGSTSGASAIIESASPRVITDRLNLGLPYELIINKKTVKGAFINGELLKTDIFGPEETLIRIEADTFSILNRINIINVGAGYNVSDPVVVIGGNPSTPAIAEVSEVNDGFSDEIIVLEGGAGFSVGSIIRSLPSLNTSAIISGAILEIDDSGTYTANTYEVPINEIIGTYANVSISNNNYGFANTVGTQNLNSRIIEAITEKRILTDLGPIVNTVLLFSNTSINTTSIDSEGALYLIDDNFYDIKDYKSIGKITVYDGGLNYKVGDEIVFSANPSGTYGVGAAAIVKTTNTSGSIISVEVDAQRLSGTANVKNNSVIVIGTNTAFDTELKVGDKITIRGQHRFVNAISSSTQLNVNTSFVFTDTTDFSNNNFVGSFNRGIIGGTNYTQGVFPSLSIISASNGSGANIAVTDLMGDGELLEAVTTKLSGSIKAIRLVDGGLGYQYIPQIDLSRSGDGSAVAEGVIGSSFTQFEGRWATSDSILSNRERLLQGKDYYLDFVYVTSSLTNFGKYKDILKTLLHPAGMKNYAVKNQEDVLPLENTTIELTSTNTISGTVNITNGTIFILGVGTKFNVANNKGIFTIGTNVAVNNEIRTISNIISNTNLSVSSAFTSNANGQTLIILT